MNCRGLAHRCCKDYMDLAHRYYMGRRYCRDYRYYMVHTDLVRKDCIGHTGCKDLADKCYMDCRDHR